MRKNLALGMAIGIIVGLFINSLILTFINEWWAITILPILLPPVLGAILGVSIMERLPRLSEWILIPVLIVGFFLIQLPRNIVEWSILSTWHQLPVYPNSEPDETQTLIITGCSDNIQPWMSGQYVVKNMSGEQQHEVLDYFMAEYVKKGWEAHHHGDYTVFRKYQEAAEVTMRLTHGSLISFSGGLPPWYPDGVVIDLTLSVHRFCGARSATY